MSEHSDEFPSEQPEQAKQMEKKPSPLSNRGKHVTAANWAAPFADDMVTCHTGPHMCCKILWWICAVGVLVQFYNLVPEMLS